MTPKFTFTTLLLWFCLVTPLMGQNYFSRTYDGNGSFDFFKSIVQDDSSYVISGNRGDDSLGYWNWELISRIDTLGQTLWDQTYGRPYSLWFDGYSHSLIHCVEGGYMQVGTMKDSTADYVSLLRFDENGDTIWSRFMDFIPRWDSQYFLELGNDAVQTPDSGFLCVLTLDSVPSTWLAHFDRSGNFEWLRPVNPANFSGYHLERGAGGNSVVGGIRRVSGTSAGRYAREVDDQANLGWSNVPAGIGAEDCGVQVIATRDSGFVLLGCRADSITPFTLITVSWVPWVAKLNASGTVLWSDELHPSMEGYDYGFTGAAEAPDGSIIVSGYRPNGEGGYRSMLLKYDTQGQRMWEQWHEVESGAYKINSIQDLFVEPDGDIVACGYIQFFNTAQPPIEDGWLLKLTPEGCVIPSRPYGLSLQAQAGQYGASVQVSWNDSTPGMAWYVERLLEYPVQDWQPAHVPQPTFTTSVLDTSLLLGSTYCYRVWGRDTSGQRGCFSDTVCIQIPDSFLVRDEARVKDLRLFPLPAQNQLNVELELIRPIGAALHAEVYSLAGERIWQGKFPASGLHFDFEINVQPFAQGPYLLRLSSAGEVLHNRIFEVQR